LSGYICSVEDSGEKEESLGSSEEFEDKRKEISIVRQAIKEGVVI
jgi:hypothetical protein